MSASLKIRHYITDAKWADEKRMSCVCMAPFQKPDPRWPAKVVILDAEDPRVVAFLKKQNALPAAS